MFRGGMMQGLGMHFRSGAALGEATLRMITWDGELEV